MGKYVIYRGVTMDIDDIHHINVEEYLKNRYSRFILPMSLNFRAVVRIYINDIIRDNIKI